MKYTDLSKEQIERVFAEDVLGKHPYKELISGAMYYHDDDGGVVYYKPLTNLDHTFLGVEKCVLKYSYWNLEYLELNKQHFQFTFGKSLNLTEDVLGYGNTPNEAIVEACIKIARPDLFEGGL